MLKDRYTEKATLHAELPGLVYKYVSAGERISVTSLPLILTGFWGFVKRDRQVYGQPSVVRRRKPDQEQWTGTAAWRAPGNP